jgi:serine/tyrosine/threonine adenylyltransferase
MLEWKLEASYLTLPERLYSLVSTDPAPAPGWVVFNNSLAESMGMGTKTGPEDLAILSGTMAPPKATVFAQAYAGHQFGHFVILGDGRAAMLGELVDPRGQRWDLQLKGSGPTSYARGGDGKAALGPMLREYLTGEYLHAVGIPSTRSLSVALSGEAIQREGWKPGAVLCRVASSHIRIGTFEYAAALSDPAASRALADYTIARHYPQVLHEKNPYAAFLDAAGSAQADLVARWMCIGFVHGVMNTDNVAISGQAIDFGPCAFLDTYRSAQVFSSIDTGGRYAWGRQPAIAGWNHARLAEALLPLLDADPGKALVLAQESVERFRTTMQERLSARFAAKLGLSVWREGDDALINGLLSWMEASQADFTATFRALTRKALGSGTDHPLPDELWMKKWLRRLEDESDPASVMQGANPAVHPRNRPVQEALDAAEQGDLEPFRRISSMLCNPWDPESGTGELAPSEIPDGIAFKTYCGT